MKSWASKYRDRWLRKSAETTHPVQRELEMENLLSRLRSASTPVFPSGWNVTSGTGAPNAGWGSTGWSGTGWSGTGSTGWSGTGGTSIWGTGSTLVFIPGSTPGTLMHRKTWWNGSPSECEEWLVINDLVWLRYQDHKPTLAVTPRPEVWEGWHRAEGCQ